MLGKKEPNFTDVEAEELSSSICGLFVSLTALGWLSKGLSAIETANWAATLLITPMHHPLEDLYPQITQDSGALGTNCSENHLKSFWSSQQVTCASTSFWTSWHWQLVLSSYSPAYTIAPRPWFSWRLHQFYAIASPLYMRSESGPQ